MPTLARRRFLAHFSSIGLGSTLVPGALWAQMQQAGAQEALIDGAPDRFFRPPYVGHRGWVGVYLDVPVDWDELDALIDDAHAAVSTARRTR